MAIARHSAVKAGTEKFDRALAEALARWGIWLEPAQLTQFRGHYEALVKTNRELNLTRITDPIDAAVKHYADSLAIMLWADKRRIELKTVLDVGTGGGFPALPLAIMRPKWDVAAIDARRKKIDFLARTVEAMRLPNLRVAHAHSEHWRPGHDFQVAMFRGIGTLAACLHWGGALISRGGWLVVYKTASLGADELAEGHTTAVRLRFHERPRFCYELECAGNTIHRVLYVYQREE